MTISELMLPEFDQESASTRKVLALVPDDKFDYKPHEKSMTLGRLAGHVAEMTGWISYVLTSEELNIKADERPCELKSRAALLEAFDKFVVAARKDLAAATDQQMAVNWTLLFEGQKIFTMTRAACIRTMCLNHTVHHRSQLAVYLRLLDIPIPGMYGPSADDKPAA